MTTPAQQEREAISDWVRSVYGEPMTFRMWAGFARWRPDRWIGLPIVWLLDRWTQFIANRLADAIERGDHHPAEKPSNPNNLGNEHG